jgi:hypothetical protein
MNVACIRGKIGPYMVGAGRFAKKDPPGKPGRK